MKMISVKIGVTLQKIKVQKTFKKRGFLKKLDEQKKKFPLMICNFPLLFSHSKNIRMLTVLAGNRTLFESFIES